MKKKTNKLIVAAFLMAQAPGVIAGYYNSSIDGISLDGMYTPDNLNDISKTVCEKYYDDPNMDKEHTQMCERGVKTAQRMAAVYAAGEGNYLGCVDGYQQGIYRGFNASSNPSAGMLREAQNDLQDVRLTNAINRGKAKASKDSRFSTESEIIKRFRDASRFSENDRITAPSKDYSDVLDVPKFDGFSDGYAADGKGGSFNDVINAGWVRSSDSINRRIQARAVARQFGIRGNLSEKCSKFPTLFNGRLHTVSMWDLFSAYGQYNFKDYGWKSTTRAWNKFKTSEEQESVAFRNIQDVKEPYQHRVGYEKKPEPRMQDEIGADGQPTGRQVPVLDANGRPVIDMVDDLTKPIFETRYRVVTGKSAEKLKKIYADSFADSYQNLAREHFGKAFVSQHKVASAMGADSGKAVGVIVAKDIAKQLAYDEKYKIQSASAFSAEYEKLFKKSWFENYNYFANNAMIEILEVDLVGKNADGIFRKNEQIRPIVKMRNLGLKKGNVRVEMDGYGLATSANDFDSLLAPASLTFTYDDGDYLGRLKDDLNVMGTTDVTVKVKGPNIDKVFALNSSKTKRITINEVAEIHGVNNQLNSFVKGDATVFVTIKNPSTQTTAAMVDLNVVLNNGRSFSASTSKLAGGEQRRVPVRMTGLDPIDIINGVYGTVSTKIGTKTIHSDSGVRMDVGLESGVSEYFHAVVNNETTNFGSDELREDRLETLYQTVVSETIKNISRDQVRWGNPAVVNRTILGKLISKYKSSSAAGKLSSEAIQVYEGLGKELNAAFKDGKDYKEFLELIQVLDPSAEKKSKKDRK